MTINEKIGVSSGNNKNRNGHGTPEVSVVGIISPFDWFATILPRIKSAISTFFPGEQRRMVELYAALDDKAGVLLTQVVRNYDFNDVGGAQHGARVLFEHFITERGGLKLFGYDSRLGVFMSERIARRLETAIRTPVDWFALKPFQDEPTSSRAVEVMNYFNSLEVPDDLNPRHKTRIKLPSVRIHLDYESAQGHVEAMVMEEFKSGPTALDDLENLEAIIRSEGSPFSAKASVMRNALFDKLVDDLAFMVAFHPRYGEDTDITNLAAKMRDSYARSMKSTFEAFARAFKVSELADNPDLQRSLESSIDELVAYLIIGEDNVTTVKDYYLRNAIRSGEHPDIRQLLAVIDRNEYYAWLRDNLHHVDWDYKPSVDLARFAQLEDDMTIPRDELSCMLYRFIVTSEYYKALKDGDSQRIEELRRQVTGVRKRSKPSSMLEAAPVINDYLQRYGINLGVARFLRRMKHAGNILTEKIPNALSGNETYVREGLTPEGQAIEYLSRVAKNLSAAYKIIESIGQGNVPDQPAYSASVLPLRTALPLIIHAVNEFRGDVSGNPKIIRRLEAKKGYLPN